MYGYEEYIDLSPEQLLQKVTQEQIIEWVLEQPFDFAERYLSPFREDNKAGCRFEERPDGAIIFVDFGDKGKTHRSCFSMVMDKHKVSLNGALSLICSKFGLSKNGTDYVESVRTSYHFKKEVERATKIDFDPIEPLKRDKIYWSQFIIKPEHLVEDNVYCTNRFYITGSSGKKRAIDVYHHCYVMDFFHHSKIYQPYSEKYKWITNCDEDDIGNIDNLPPNGRELIISGAYKDHRVLRNLEQRWSNCVIWFQNEGVIPSEHILMNLISRFEILTFFYDNDAAGRAAAKKLVDICNYIRIGCARAVHLPRRKYTWKDIGEFVNKEGRADTVKILKYIGL